MINVKEISQDEFSEMTLRTKNKWNDKEIKQFCEKTYNQYKTKILQIYVTELFKNFYSGTTQIKYRNYYTKKHLEMMFKKLNISAKVFTQTNKTDNSKDVVIIQFLKR